MIPNAARPFNFDLGESAEMIRESTRQFAEAEIAPRAARKRPASEARRNEIHDDHLRSSDRPRQLKIC